WGSRGAPGHGGGGGRDGGGRGGSARVHGTPGQHEHEQEADGGKGGPRELFGPAGWAARGRRGGSRLRRARRAQDAELRDHTRQNRDPEDRVGETQGHPKIVAERRG